MAYTPFKMKGITPMKGSPAKEDTKEEHPAPPDPDDDTPSQHKEYSKSSDKPDYPTSKPNA